MPFSHRYLSFQFQLGTGSFGESGFNTVTVTDLRASVSIVKTAAPSKSTATMRIMGLTPSIMNQLSRIGVLPNIVRNNIVTVMAGDSPSNLSLAFAGGIWDAWPDFIDSPDVGFNVISYTGLLEEMKPALPTSFPGSVDVATIMATLANQMGYKFENNGVSVMLSNPYLPGTARAQAVAAAAAADIYLVFDDQNNIMAILPKDGVRATVTPLLSPDTGMVGYPSYIGPGKIALKSVYNSSLRFMGSINVQSSDSNFPSANGLWRITRLQHNLETWTPKGAWFSEMQGSLYLADRS
jgi:hypothetical protein